MDLTKRWTDVSLSLGCLSCLRSLKRNGYKPLLDTNASYKVPSEFLWGNSDLLWSARPAWDTRLVAPWSFWCQEAPDPVPCCSYYLCRDITGIRSAAWNGCWIRPECSEGYASLSSFADAKNHQLWPGCGTLLGCNMAGKDSSSKQSFAYK